MVVNELKELFNKQYDVKFKLYSLEYLIKVIDNK